MSDICLPNCDLAEEKDSGISQVSADGLGMAGLKDKLNVLDIQTGLDGMSGRGLSSNGRGVRGPQAMDDMLYGNSDNINHGKYTS